MLAGCSGSETDGKSTTEDDGRRGHDCEARRRPNRTMRIRGPYSVTMSPVGTVELESVPANVMVYSLLYADMAVAYGTRRCGELAGIRFGGGRKHAGRVLRTTGRRFLRPERTDTTQHRFRRRQHRQGTVLRVGFGPPHGRPRAGACRSTGGRSRTSTKSRRRSRRGSATRTVVNTANRRRRIGTTTSTTRSGKSRRRVAAVFREQERYEALASVHDDLLERIRVEPTAEGRATDRRRRSSSCRGRSTPRRSTRKDSPTPTFDRSERPTRSPKAR